jgi:hypothetical protein
MIVPESLIARVVSDNGDTDLSDIILELEVHAGRKNPYRVYFPKTDRAGVTVLTRDDFIGQFLDHWEASLMDHDGSVESASPRMTARLYDPTWAAANPQLALAWPLLPHEKTKWRSREEEYRYKITARNAEFVAPPVTLDVEEKGEVVVPLRRKA